MVNSKDKKNNKKLFFYYILGIIVGFFLACFTFVILVFSSIQTLDSQLSEISKNKIEVATITEEYEQKLIKKDLECEIKILNQTIEYNADIFRLEKYYNGIN